ncbi:YihY/virulence factor BrkB family protein [uncultured Mobiluncus sp.]|uniref:YihY/virulence factor BrkB family protein n=1 Tax=uncultured Mobiluncus sp. TaxID=293425 RepID=UPI002639450D|nr:YhjD/YihY/BrkB family envelope integrity protein [uncultured Mobiluncus sp.]
MKQPDSQPVEPTTPARVVELSKAFLEWLNTTRFMRAYLRYQNASANLLAGGIAYTALFSMAGIVTLIIMTAQVMIFAFPMTSHTIFQDVNQWIPGAIQVDGQPGLIDPAAIATPSFTWGTLVVLVVSIMAGIRVVAALRVCIQTVFGLPQRPGEGWKNALRDVCMFLVLFLSGILASVLGSGSIVAVRALQRRLPLALPVPPGLINVGAFVLTSILATLILAFTLRYLALVRAPRRDLWIGTGALGFLSTALQMSGAYLASSVPPAYAPFTLILTIILWVNVLGRLFLYMSCWIANPPAAPAPVRDFPHFSERPNFVTVSAPASLSWPHDPLSGRIWSPAQEEAAWRLSQQVIWSSRDRRETAAGKRLSGHPVAPSAASRKQNRR